MATTELALPKLVEILAPGGQYELGKLALRKEHGQVLQNAKKLEGIKSAEQADEVTSFGRLLQAAKSESEAFYKPFKKQVDDIKAPILADEHQDVDAYVSEGKRLGSLMTVWTKHCIEQQAIADRLAREEAERKAQEEQLLRAIEVESIEGIEAAEEVLAAPLQVASVVTQSMMGTKPRGSVFKTTYKATLTNKMDLIKAVAEGKVSLEALDVNQSFLNKQATGYKEGMSIPGVAFAPVDSTGFRR